MRARWRRLILLLVDGLLISSSYLLAFWLRLGDSGFLEQSAVIARTLPVLLGISLLVHWRLGLFHSILRYASLETASAVFRATLTSVLLSCLVLFLLFRLEGVPRAVFAIHAMAALIGVGGVRVGYRWYRSRDEETEGTRRVLLFGVSDATDWVLRGISVARDHPWRAVGLLDDDPLKHGRLFHGLKIHGGLGILADVISATGAEELWVAIPDVDGGELRRIYAAASERGLRVKILSPTAAGSAGGFGDSPGRDLPRFREPEIADLLRRPPRSLDRERVRSWIEGRRVLITGAGGSIGSELARQVKAFRPARLALCDSCEYNLFAIHRELTAGNGAVEVRPYLVDVRDRAGVEQMFAAEEPHVVFHAAAYKHVPMVERNPCQGVVTNVAGLWNVARAAIDRGVSEFVFISTDKAVRPVNVMGATKRLGEVLVQALDRGASTRLCAVRFGNVLGSSGSVVPIFKEQIRRGGPITVTHPDMRRYFMLVSEAAQLVTQAGSIAQGGEIFVLDMGEPVRIADMARDLVRLMGKEPEIDVEIRYTGTRPGEKIDEELLIDARDSRTPYRDIWIDGDSSAGRDREELEREFAALVRAARGGDERESVGRLVRLVSEFVPEFARTRELARWEELVAADTGAVGPVEETPRFARRSSALVLPAPVPLVTGRRGEVAEPAS